MGDADHRAGASQGSFTFVINCVFSELKPVEFPCWEVHL